MKILLAIDSFKGCLTSAEVSQAFSDALKAKGADTFSIPVSDGGEGMLEAFINVLGGQTRNTLVHDPLMRPITADYGVAPDGTAIIETARACGLTLMTPQERNPMIATTYGVGELISAAINDGCRNIIIGLGGSGTSDSGKGMLRALEERFPDGMPENCRFTLACDVENPLFGENGAAHIFGRQKGATIQMIELLDRQAREFAAISAAKMGKDTSSLPGAGAAGGLGYAFMQYMDAKTVPGADLLLELSDFDKNARDSDLIITGEGKADRQTLMGKLPFRVLKRASSFGIPVWLVAGMTKDIHILRSAGFAKVGRITPTYMPIPVALRPQTATRNIFRWVDRNFRNMP